MFTFRFTHIGLLVALCGVAEAAQIRAIPASAQIGIGASTTVRMFVDLGPAEQASVFEARFDLGGLVAAATVFLTPGGASWGSAFGNIADPIAAVSLTSANATGSRLVATLNISGVAAGSYDIRLANPPPLVAFDIPAPPFLQLVPVGPAPGTILANILVTDGIDTDGDGIDDVFDNCSLVANANQRDTDGDGFGNVCDGDLNDDCFTNFVDLGIFRARFFGGDPDADLNGDGGVNFGDLNIFKTLIFLPPGPSGVAACPAGA